MTRWIVAAFLVGWMLAGCGRAEADCGWLLVSPPIDRENAPYSQWLTVRSFDSAEQCERYLLDYVDLALANKKKNVKLTLSAAESKCIPFTAKAR